MHLLPTIRSDIDVGDMIYNYASRTFFTILDISRNNIELYSCAKIEQSTGRYFKMQIKRFLLQLSVTDDKGNLKLQYFKTTAPLKKKKKKNKTAV